MKNEIYEDYSYGGRMYYIITIKGYKKYIGMLKKDGVYEKKIESIHKFQKGKAYGIDYGLIEKLAKRKCSQIKLVIDSKNYMFVGFDYFLRAGYKYPRSVNVNIKGKFQPQQMLPVDKWNRVVDGELICSIDIEKKATQTRLFK